MKNILPLLKEYGLMALQGAVIGAVVVGVNRQLYLIGPDNATRHTY